MPFDVSIEGQIPIPVMSVTAGIRADRKRLRLDRNPTPNTDAAKKISSHTAF